MANFTLFENGCCITSGDHSRNIPDKTNGTKKKKYYISSAKYREIASSAVNLWNKRKNKLTFFTLTFPFDVDETTANKCFSKFVENLKLNYELKNYIAVKERGETGNKIHFHAIFDIRWTNILVINKAWCSTFRKYHVAVTNSIRLPTRRNGGAIIQSQKRCVKYICKYIGKQKDRQYYEKPCVFISRDILSKPLKISQDDLEGLKQQYKFIAYVSKYTTSIQFYKDNDRKEQVYFSNES